MITLYSYPTLFGVADNNGYGLKVFAFMRLVGLPFVHEHIFDASAAPRGQLPYIIDDGDTFGDSETIITHLIGKYRLTIDAALGVRERNLSLLITRLLDDLYWVMSYSRWKDERYWPAFRSALMREHAGLTDEGLAKAREFNFQRYHFQGIGRYEPDAAYARGLADLGLLALIAPAVTPVTQDESPAATIGEFGEQAPSDEAAAEVGQMPNDARANAALPGDASGAAAPEASTADPGLIEPTTPQPRQHPLRFMWQMDADGRFSLGSDAFTRLIGVPAAAGFGRP